MPSASLTQALCLLLHGPTKTANPNIVLLDYRDSATFSALWLKGLESGRLSIGGQQFDLTDSTKQFLLIGNDPPDGIFDTKIAALAGINFRSHFTATSWLAAWKVKFSPTEEEKKKGAKESLARIAVIDPRESRHAQGAARALQTILGAKDANGNSLVPGVAVLNAPSLTDISKWLKPSVTDTRILAKNAPHLRDLLKSTIWNELTSDRERHHALSNVLGAFLLPIQAFPGEASGLLGILRDNYPFALYLLELVNACGGKASVEKISTGSAIESDDNIESGNEAIWWISENQREAFSSAVLIDDMSEIWRWFVHLALGLVGDHKSKLHTIPAEDFRTRMSGLCGRLNNVIVSTKSLRPSDLIGKNVQHNDPIFVLFLDLRLELGGEFQAQLEELGKELLKSDKNLPWLTDEGKRELQAELDTGKTNETLLPRLIALIDPTLPIIIFSSTHRSELIDPFREYGNIITSFRKPIITGMAGSWQQIVDDLRADFVTSIAMAKRINSARLLLRKVAPTTE